MRDIRFAIRTLLKSPAFSATAALILAIGIGLTTAQFSIVRGVLLKPLNYPSADRIYVLHEIVPQWQSQIARLDANLPDFEIWRNQAKSFDELAVAEDSSMIISGTGEAQQLRAIRASANFLAMLGAKPAIGRLFRQDEDSAGHGYSVVLTDSIWRTRFSADPAIVGRSVTLDGTTYTVIGILPRSFVMPGVLNGFSPEAQLFTPLNGKQWYEQDLIGEFDFTAIGRLKSGVSAQQASAELNTIQAAIAKQANQKLDLRAELVPLQTSIVGRARPGLLLLLSATGAVLLLICINIANLLLARVPARLRDSGIRKALGASDAQLLRQTIIETLLLTGTAGAMGIAVAHYALQLFVRFGPSDIPRLSEAHIDAWALAFAVAACITTALLAGAFPAFLVSRVSLSATLAAVGRSATEGRRSRNLRALLIATEVGLCTMLLIVAGLLGRSIEKLLNIDAGFRADHVLTASVTLPPAAYKTARPRAEFYDRALQGIRALPGAESAAFVHILPLTGEGSDNGINYVDHRLGPKEEPIALYRVITPDYFKTMGIPLLAGRSFTDADHGKLRIVISHSLAQRMWPGQDPVGKQAIAEWANPKEPSEIVGVVGDVRSRLDRPAQYTAYTIDMWAGEGQPQPHAPGAATFVIRTAQEPSSLSNAVRAVIHDADPDVPIVALRPMSQVVASRVEGREFQLSLTSMFAVAALFLAALGIVGVLAYSVEQRTREFGIRSALGAHRGDLLAMIMRQGMLPVALGTAAGLIAALAGSSALRALLYGVSVADPLTFAAVVLIVVVVGGIACYWPAMRATQVDPMVALRYE